MRLRVDVEAQRHEALTGSTRPTSNPAAPGPTPSVTSGERTPRPGLRRQEESSDLTVQTRDAVGLPDLVADGPWPCARAITAIAIQRCDSRSTRFLNRKASSVKKACRCRARAPTRQLGNHRSWPGQLGDAAAAFGSVPKACGTKGKQWELLSGAASGLRRAVIRPAQESAQDPPYNRSWYAALALIPLEHSLRLVDFEPSPYGKETLVRNPDLLYETGFNVMQPRRLLTPTGRHYRLAAEAVVVKDLQGRLIPTVCSTTLVHENEEPVTEQEAEMGPVEICRKLEQPTEETTWGSRLINRCRHQSRFGHSASDFRIRDRPSPIQRFWNTRIRHTVAHSMTDTDYTKIGPRVGEMFPDFELPDASGNPLRLTRWRNDRPALVFFFRSAAW
jgi:hypothetical protein